MGDLSLDEIKKKIEEAQRRLDQKINEKFLVLKEGESVVGKVEDVRINVETKNGIRSYVHLSDLDENRFIVCGHGHLLWGLRELGILDEDNELTESAQDTYVLLKYLGKGEKGHLWGVEKVI